MNKAALQFAFVYVSVIVGAGYTSGQEILQFFTGYGLYGIAGTIVAAVLFALLGMQIGRISANLRVNSHKELLAALFGHRLGSVIDSLLTFFLFGVGVVMVAGTGSLLNQRYGIEVWQGATFMAILVALTLCLNMRRIVEVIATATPILVLSVVVLSTYALMTADADIETLKHMASMQPTVSKHWFVAALLYASFSVAMGFPLLAAIAGRNGNARNMVVGGLIGGLGLGALIFVMNVSLFSNLNQIQGAEVPTLRMMLGITPWLSTMFVVTLICMIYSSAVSMFLSCCVRFAEPGTRGFRYLSVALTVAGLLCSFVGFTALIGTVYPLLGYVGFALILSVFYYSYKHSCRVKQITVANYAASLNR